MTLNNIIFYFSGTGNSLKAAKTISKELGNSEIVSMAKPGKYSLGKKYDTVGFIFPVYCCGLPKKVIEFVENMNLSNNNNSYFYSIATCGGSAGNAVYQIYELLLNKHGIKLNYGQELRMFSNYVVLYNMKENVDEITKKSNENLIPIISSIKKKENNKVKKFYKILNIVNKLFLKYAISVPVPG